MVDKNKISDTDSFWNQLDHNEQQQSTPTAAPISGRKPTESLQKEASFSMAAERKDGSIAINRNEILRAVEQFREGGETKTDSKKEISDSVKEQKKSARERVSNGREKQSFPQKKNRAKRETIPKENKGSVTMSKNTVIAIVAAAVVCIGSFLGIFWKLNADKVAIVEYLQTELADIRADNDAAIAEMRDTLGRMETNFDEIVSLLEETGASIGSSSQASRNAISQRIEKLDKQLQSLQKSLAILQEDANGRKK